MPASTSVCWISLALRQHGLAPVVAADRHDHDLIRRDERRQHEPAVVAVDHDDGADEPRRHAPRRAPDVLHRLVARLERDVERLREILAEVVRRAGLQRAAVAHQRFDRIGPERAGKLLALALHALDDRHREHRLAHLGVEVENLQRLGLGLRLGLVGRVPLLPEKLGRPQERTRHLLPADDVRPLIDEDRQIAPRLHPFRVHRADDRLGRRPDDELLLELLAAAVRHVGDLRRKAFDVLRFLVQEAFGNEQREVRVHVAGRLDPRIERLLNQLPDRVAVRPDDHAALDRRVVGQLRAADDVEVPAREVLRARRDFGDERVGLFGHEDRLWALGFRL